MNVGDAKSILANMSNFKYTDEEIIMAIEKLYGSSKSNFTFPKSYAENSIVFLLDYIRNNLIRS